MSEEISREEIAALLARESDGMTREESTKMREATPEERESIDKYIKSISKPTGVNFLDLDQESKTGHWIIISVDARGVLMKCDKCERLVCTESPGSYTYCPSCGTKMVEREKQV